MKLSMDINSLADATDLSARTIEEMVKEGTFPQPIQPRGGKRIWRVKTVDEWLANKESAVAKSNDLERIRRHARS